MTSKPTARVRVNKTAAGPTAPPTATAPPPETTAPGLAPSLSQEVIAEALKQSVVWEGGEEGKGRKIVLRRPSVFSGPKFALAVGAEAASNQAFMQMIEPLMYVAEIDGDPVPPPVSMLDVEALAEQLSHEGVSAVNIWFMTYIMQPMMDAATQAKQKAALKNG